MKVFLQSLVLVACIVGLVAIWTLFTSQSRGRFVETRGIALGANSTSIATDNLPPLGINVDLQREPPASLPATLALVRDGGYRFVRQSFPWREIEPAKGTFQWGRWDNLVESYRDHRLQVIAVLAEPPAWSRRDNNWINRPPDNLADFGDFVAAFAAHYRGKIGYLQIWDEPNLFPNWGNRAVDPAGYVALLAESYVRAKQANPDVTVLLAGLAPNVEAGGRNMSDLLFLSALYENGARPYFDVAAAKPYGLWYLPEDRDFDPGRTSFARVVRWRELMVANGDSTKPIWAVEFGWNGLPADWSGAASAWGRVTPEEQAAYTKAALLRARAEWPWLPVLILQGHFSSLPAGDARVGFDIVDANGRPKPLYAKLRELASQPYASVGLHTVANNAVDLDGPWQLSGTLGTAQPGGALTVGFVGSRLDLIVNEGPEGGVARVAVDGRPAPGLIKVGVAAWLDTRSRIERQARVTVADGLGSGVHTLELVATSRRDLWPQGVGAGDSVAVSGIDVIREPEYGALPWQFAGASLAGMALLMMTLRIVASWPWANLGMWPWRRACNISGSVAHSVTYAWQSLDAIQRDLAALAALLAILSSMYVAPVAVLVLLVAAAIALVRSRLAIGALALVASAPFGSLQVRIGDGRFAPAEIISIVVAIALVARLASWPKLGAAVCSILASPASWLLSGFNGAIVMLVLAGGLSTVFADYQSEAWRELRTVIVEPAVMYLAVLAAFNLVEHESEHRDPLWLMDALVIAGVAVSVIGLYQYLFTADVITAEGVYRLRALYGSPNNVGLFLGRIIPMACCVALVAGPRRRPYLLALLLMVAAVALTFSLGAWLGIAASLLFVWIAGGVRPRVAVAVAFAMGAVAVVMLPTQRLLSHLTLNGGTSSVRLLVWQAALNMLRDHPLLGVGPDNFYRHYRERYILPDAWREPNLSHPHNLVLDFLLRTGVAGFVIGLAVLVAFFSRGIRLWRSQTDSSSRMLTLGLLASMVDFVVHGLVDNSLFLTDLALVFWMTCGLLEVLRRRQYNRAALGEET